MGATSSRDTFSASRSPRRTSPSCCATTSEQWPRPPAKAHPGRLLRLDAGRREYLSVLGVIALQDRFEFLGRPTRDVQAAVGESPADIGLSQNRLDFPVHPQDDLPRSRRRHHYAVPGDELEIRYRLSEHRKLAEG